MPLDKPASTPTQPAPRVRMQPAALDPELLRKLKVGADSREALEKASGGQIERMGRRSLDDTFILNIGGQRFVYVRVQDVGGVRKDAYRTDGLRRSLDPLNRFKGHDLDHVASAGVEGGSMGNRFALLALVPSLANRSHGATNEKGPAPLREFNKFASGGLDGTGSHHASGWTREMFMKIAGRKSDGRGRSMLREPPSKEDLVRAHTALMQEPEMQARLANMAKQGRAFDARAAGLAPVPARPGAASPKVSAASGPKVLIAPESGPWPWEQKTLAPRVTATPAGTPQASSVRTAPTPPAAASKAASPSPPLPSAAAPLPPLLFQSNAGRSR